MILCCFPYKSILKGCLSGNEERGINKGVKKNHLNANLILKGLVHRKIKKLPVHINSKAVHLPAAYVNCKKVTIIFQRKNKITQLNTAKFVMVTFFLITYKANNL